MLRAPSIDWPFRLLSRGITTIRRMGQSRDRAEGMIRKSNNAVPSGRNSAGQHRRESVVSNNGARSSGAAS